MKSNEETYLVKVKGVSPLILHNSAGADPMNDWTLKMKPIKNKKKKTESDLKDIRDLSFLSSLYWSEELDGIFMPVDNVRKMLLESGRACDQRGAKKQIVGVRFTHHLGWALNVKNRSNIEKLKEDESLRYFKIVTISRAKVPSVRAIFHQWSFEFEVVIDVTIINPSTVEEWLQYAGNRVGLGCRRPYAPTPGEFGRFYIEEFKKIEG